MFKTAKVHDVVKGEDTIHGTGVLVDRMWPRGVAKSDLDYEEWFKDVAPSPELRTWWNHDEDRFDEFARRYKAELDDNDSDELAQLRALADATLLFAATNRTVNHAVVLKEWLEEHLRK
ncbi:DUF488 family protein [Corynebacterium sp. MSK105]|uniref:DUF488 domain-containing protein n=1 Tax=unclassified Corynebacterium TaxID=2624378 RepID=UPI00254E68F0|nr:MULTISPECIES: DUF488 family protein [unclassified Corynebacterium]MDK8483604.1 DUF488 family protein [Corynebacterium sp. MSK074]MDK8691022.1 DUF488 family protein [Corynebacterium sp. MSK105]